MNDKLWRVSDLLNLAGSDRASEASQIYEELIQDSQITPHIEEEVIRLPSGAKLGKNKYRRHWISTTQALALLSAAYPKPELAAMTLGASIVTQQIESKGIKLI